MAEKGLPERKQRRDVDLLCRGTRLLSPARKASKANGPAHVRKRLCRAPSTVLHYQSAPAGGFKIQNHRGTRRILDLDLLVVTAQLYRIQAVLAPSVGVSCGLPGITRANLFLQATYSPCLSYCRFFYSSHAMLYYLDIVMID
jgi:hypothetical protein